MDLEYLPEEVKKELYEELNFILTNYNLRPKLNYLIGPLNHPERRRSRLDEILSGFKLHLPWNSYLTRFCSVLILFPKSLTLKSTFYIL